MDWKSLLFLLLVFVFAAVILYRAVFKKRWCPDIYGSRGCAIKPKGAGEEKKPPGPPDEG